MGSQYCDAWPAAWVIASKSDLVPASPASFRWPLVLQFRYPSRTSFVIFMALHGCPPPAGMQSAAVGAILLEVVCWPRGGRLLAAALFAGPANAGHCRPTDPSFRGGG